jgi:uncharacterized protein
MTPLDKYSHIINDLCKKHKVRRLYAFGSILTNKFTEASDIDLMVDFESVELQQYADNYFSLKFALEDTLNRKVDLLEERAVKNPYFKKAVEGQRQLIYGSWTQSLGYDILSAIHEIETFHEDVPNFLVYKDDLKSKRAIERNLEIIGEAMNRMLKRNPGLGFQNARKIVETRNRISHGYDTVSDEIIWSIITISIPILKIEIEQFLGE